MLKNRLPLNYSRAYAGDIELKEILSEGETLRRDVELLQGFSHIRHEHQKPALSLKGKMGLSMGAALLAGTSFDARDYFLNAHTSEQANNLIPPISTGAITVTSAMMYAGVPDKASDPLPSPHNGPVNVIRHKRHHSVDSPSSTTEKNIHTKGKREHHGGDGSLLSHHIKKANEEIVKFFQKKNLLGNGPINKEERISAVASYFFNSDSKDIAEHTTQVKTLARIILTAVELYGGRKEDTLSIAQAESVIRHWVFHNILGASPEEYITRSMAHDDHPSHYTVSSIHYLLSLHELLKNKLLHLHKIPENRWSVLNAMWSSFLIQEMPFLKFEEDSVKNIELSSYDFPHIYSGTRFLEETGLRNYTYNEARQVGEKIWNLAFTEGITEEKIAYFRAPSLFFMANYSPDRFNQVQHINDISLTAINEYIQHRKIVEEIRQDIALKYKNYQSAVKKWVSKGKLADDIISQCPTGELFSLPNIADAILTKSQRREKAVRSAKQNYMNDLQKPCKGAPKSLDDEYQKLTSHVADSFYEFDKYLVPLAFNGLSKKEYDFIFSPETTISFVTVYMEGRYRNYFTKQLEKHHILLDGVDLISADKANLERIYALHRINNNNAEGYKITRVNFDIQAYIRAGIVNYKNLERNHKSYNKHRDKIIIDNKIPIYMGNEEKNLVDFLIKKHRDNLYHSLYTSGNALSDIQQFWSVVKHIIPLYDCIEGIVNQDADQAIPSCLLDAVSLIPVFGQAASLSVKFGMSLARGVRGGALAFGKKTISSAVKNTLREISLPTVTELASLGKSALRSIDPGFELMTVVSRDLHNKIITLLLKDKKTADLAKSIPLSTMIDKLPSAPSGKPDTAFLSGTKIQIPVKYVGEKYGKDIYVRFNPETALLNKSNFC